MHRYTLILAFLLSLFLLSGCDSGFMSETVDYGDLIEREGLFYKKFSNTPYTGKVTGEEHGSMKKGKREGEYLNYYDNGQLENEGNYKNGEREGEYLNYYDNGQLENEGNYKNGKEEGEYVRYYKNGQLSLKGTYKNGKEEGEWVFYDTKGNISFTQTYKNGKKISD
jgi:hypothetical protein